MGRSASVVSLGLSLVLLFATCQNAQSQVLYGSIVGSVRDASDAAVSGAAVTVTNTETNQAHQAISDELGNFTVPTLQAGTYSVKVLKDGFASFTVQAVAVTINTVTRVEAALKVGALSESVTVEAGAAALQTDRSEVRAEMLSREMVNLPVAVGRNYQQLFRALPGFTPPQNSHSIPTNPSRSLTFNVNGTSESSNNTRIDGASSTHIQLPHVVAYIPSLESIEAVNVVTNSFDAEQGLTGGAAIIVQTKSGTNELHGSGFEYHTDQHIKARPFFTPADYTKPKLVYNQFGGTVGGPIKRDKLFYFIAYEATFDRRNAEKFGTVPTAAMKAGDMSASGRTIFDPSTGDAQGAGRTPLAGNLLPASRVSPISLKLAALTPPPNLGGVANNLYVAAPFQFDRHTVDTKLNYSPTSKLTTFLRFSVLHYDSYNRQMFGDALGGPPIAGGNPGYSDGGTYSATAAVTYTFAPNFLLDAYYGYTRMDTSSQQPRLDEKLGLDYLGIPGTNGPRKFEGGWPRFVFTGLTTLGIDNDFMPYFRRDPQYQYVVNFNWTKGTHNIRFGTDLYRQHLNQQQAEFVGGAFHGAQGGFTFGTGPTSARGESSDRYNSYASFLLGLPTRIGKILLVPDEYNERIWLYSFYVRDRWNVNRKLTLDYGMRWEYFPVPTRSDRGLERYDPDTNKMLVCGIGSVPNDCGVQVSKRRFAPRFGLAYRPTGTLVLRAGYGITNDPFNPTELLRANYPVMTSLNLQGPNSFQPAGTLARGIPTIAVPDLGNGIIDIPGSYATGTLPKNYRRGYIQSWNVTVQKQLKYGLVGQAGYVATRSVRELGFVDINAGQEIGKGEAGMPLNVKYGRDSATTMSMPVGTGQYNSLQTTLDRRFSQGLSLGVHYTWSKSIGIVDASDASPQVQATKYWNLNRAVSGFDRTHALHITNIWELPFGRNHKWLSERSVLSAIAGGWQINNLVSFLSGAPFTVTASGDALDMPGSAQRADQIKGSVQKLGAIGSDSPWFDPLAFADVTEPRFGTSGFNTLRGPGLSNWDLGLFREFKVTERYRIQFRAEAFNLTNTPHFANPDSDVSAMSVSNGRIEDLGGFATITGTANLAREGIDERQFRFGLRLSW